MFIFINKFKHFNLKRQIKWNGVLPSTYSGNSLPFVKTVK